MRRIITGRLRHSAGRSGLVALCLWAVGLSFALTATNAHACDEENPEQYRSDLTVWCIDPTVWAEHQTEIQGFFEYGDGVISKLTEVFSVSPDNLPYSIVARTPDGGAQTPTRYGPGVEVTGDAFWGELGGVQGFWGYLLVLHEFVNQWTGLVTGGWPTDWWADHRSPFPNAMDELIIRELGHPDAADIQHGRMEGDAQVQLFLQIFNREGYGFDGYEQAFALIQDDGLNWGALRDPPNYTDHSDCVSGNPSELLAEYVTAYLSLPAGEDLTPMMIDAGVGDVVDDLCPKYTPSSQAVGDIADAHCGIAAGRAGGIDVSSATDALRMGNYAAALVEGYDCATDCPSECACSSTEQRCLAPWRGDLPAAVGSGGAGAGGGANDVGGAPGVGMGGSVAAGGNAASAGATPMAQQPIGSGGDTTVPMDGTTPVDGTPAGPMGGTGTSSGSDAGCGCHTAGTSSSNASSLWGLALLGLAIGRRRSHRRTK